MLIYKTSPGTGASRRFFPGGSDVRQARHPRVLRRGDQYVQLPGGRSGDQARRRDRSGARLRSQVRRGGYPLGRGHPRRRGRGRPDDRMVARDPRPRRPLVRLALREGEDRRQDRYRREHQGGAAHLPAGVQRHRPQDGRQRLRSPVQGRRAVQDRASSRSRSSTPPGTRPPASATRSRMPCSSAIPCSCRTTAPRAPTSPAATRTSSIGRSASS